MSIEAAPIYTGDFREIFRNPIALVGAIIGTALTGILLALSIQRMNYDCEHELRKAWGAEGRKLWSAEFQKAVDGECGTDGGCLDRLRLAWLAEDRIVYSLEYGLALSDACPAPPDEEAFEIDFEPGALVKLGVEIPEEELPEKIVTIDTRLPDETIDAPATVTTDEKAKPQEPDKKLERDKDAKKPDKPLPKDNKDKKLPTSLTPTEKNTPYNDLPTVDKQRGDPFGDPDGWADMRKDGDKWATDVMKELNKMKVGAYAARAGAGDFRFQITVCKDGKISQIAKKGGSLPQDVQNQVKLALEQLDLPKPPPETAKLMGSNCAKIGYTFVWSAGGVK